jgi:hypothetical protein
VHARENPIRHGARSKAERNEVAPVDGEGAEGACGRVGRQGKRVKR